METAKNITIVILLVLVVGFALLWFRSEKSLRVVGNVDEIVKCAQLYELKKSSYWGDEIGQSKYIFNKKLNTCLALNIYNNVQSGDYFAMVIDMSNDKTLLYYSDEPKGFYIEGDRRIGCKNSYNYLEYFDAEKQVKDFGCENYGLMNTMFEQVRAFGFQVFDAAL